VGRGRGAGRHLGRGLTAPALACVAGLASPIVAGALAAALPALPAAPAAPAISASVSAREITFGASVIVSGRITQEGAGDLGAPLELQAEAYPLHRFHTIARTASAEGGGFEFARVRLSRDTRVRVVDPDAGGARSHTLAVTVDARVQTHARRLGAGRTQLSVRLWHTRWNGSARVDARWFIAPRDGRTFRLVAVTATKELAPGLTYAELVVEPPARRFSYRVCLNPPWERAMGRPAAHGRCPARTYTVSRRAR
jgi:hypothetical protein